jgi:hypothetical protein
MEISSEGSRGSRFNVDSRGNKSDDCQIFYGRKCEADPEDNKRKKSAMKLLTRLISDLNGKRECKEDGFRGIFRRKILLAVETRW